MIRKFEDKTTALVFLFIVLVSAIFWRFFNYSNRVVFNQDQARDAIIALYSIRTGKIPLVGPPSSAGSFSFGPLYYWFVIGFTLLPFGPLSPWIGFTLLSITSVILFFFLGKAMSGKVFSFISGLVAAFFAAEVVNAPEMLNTVLVTFATTLALFLTVKAVKEERKAYFLPMGFSVGLAINSHFQSLGLLSLIVGIFIVYGRSFKDKTLALVFSFLGLAVSFLPLAIFDIKNNHALLKNLLDYYLIGQQKFNYLTSWATEIREFWPEFWGKSTVGLSGAGYVLLVSTFLLVTFKIYPNFVSFLNWAITFFKGENKALNLAVTDSKVCKICFVFAFAFVLQAVMLRYYKGTRSVEYLNVFLPFIIFFTSWAIWSFYKINKYLGVALIVAFVVVSSYSNIKTINSFGQFQKIISLKKVLDNEPKTNIQMYSFGNSSMVSLPLFYLFYYEDRAANEGRKIGACEYIMVFNEETFEREISCPFKDQVVAEVNPYVVYNLDNLLKENLDKEFPKQITAEEIYSWLTANYKIN